MTILLILIILFPMAAAFFGYLFRKSWAWPSLAAAALSFAATLAIAINLDKGETISFSFGGLAGQPFVLKTDLSSSVLSTVVAVVALAIFIYGRGYMHKEKNKSWFWSAMSLFLTAMQLTLMAGDWFLFITGWEIMGLASFLLIGTWHEKESARFGAVKAFMLTRFADLGLYAGVFAVVLGFHSLLIPTAPTEKITLLAAACFLLAVVGKSAQVPFQSWLSGAMAGPTPVSALLHSATMVAAGAVLLFRIYPLLNHDSLIIIAWTGGITIILTGLTAITSTDIKQMLAASTSSQLGFMLLALGLGYPGAAFAHWIAHAFMKSSLFLGAGIFQHAYESTAFKKISGGGQKFKTTFWGFALAGIGLSGVPPLIGYWSKDAILSSAAKYPNHSVFFIIAVLGALFTAMYMGKAIQNLWIGDAKDIVIPKKTWMTTGLILLVIFILAGGFFLEHLVKVAGYEIPKDMLSKIAGISAALGGLALGWFWKERWLPEKLSRFIRDNYPLAGGYNNIIAKPVLQCAEATYWLDKKIHQMVFAIGKATLQTAQFAFSTDRGVKWLAEKMGDLSIASSEISEKTDSGILTGVESLASNIKHSGGYSKKWQSGLVHKELIITVAGILIMIFVLTITLTKI